MDTQARMLKKVCAATLCLCTAFAALSFSATSFAQEPDEMDEEDRNIRTPAVQTGADDSQDETAISPGGPPNPEAEQAAAKPPAIPAPPPPSPFVFQVKGLVSGSMFLQNIPTVGSGGSLAFSTNRPVVDGWFLGGDVRQTRLTFTVRGPEVFGGATPTGVAEMDLGGYNYQVLAASGLTAVVGTPNGMGGTAVVPLPYNVVTNEPRFDESLVPHVRLAYVELNWNNSQNLLRVGQYHNLLLGMVAGSASHIALPLGYGAGQLGWRSPGITYLHRFALSATSNLDIGVQINRNSWRDELPNCGATQTAQVNNCLPYGVSAGEASMLPQVEGRIMAFGGMAENPLPFYLPVKWLAYIVAHWDRKDLSGAGSNTVPATTGAPYRDSMDTFATQAGFKTQLGPVLIAANGWYGKNAGNVFGHIFQMQNLNGPDITGFGAWGQLGIGLTKNLSLWGFGGIDKPDEKQVRAAGSTLALAGTTVARNVQVMTQLAYTDGPVQVGVEFMYVMTTALYLPTGVMMAPGGPDLRVLDTRTAMQPSVTLNYNF
jgi:hypothetical protein